MPVPDGVRLTRVTAQLADRAQERRFREFTMATERRTVGATAAVIFVIDLAAVLADTVAGKPVTAVTFVSQSVIAALLIAASALLRWGPRRHRAPHVMIAIGLLFAVVGIVVATREGMAFGGAMLLLAGVMVIYLAGRFNLTIAVGNAVVFTAVVLPAWLLTDPPPSRTEVLFTVVVVALAHLLGVVEAHRTQRERRILFAQHELLARMSATDELTGLINRRGLQRALDTAWARWRRRGTPLAVVMLDIDHFKDFNDTYGHLTGDVALRLVAQAIRDASPPDSAGLAARYGGEEFLCLLPDTSLADAIQAAERMRAAVEQVTMPIPTFDGVDVRPALTISAGVATADGGTDQVGDLIRAVDERLYRAKAAGRNRVEPAAEGTAPPHALLTTGATTRPDR